MITKQLRLLTTLAACALLPLGVHAANDIEPGKDTYSAIKVTNPIVIDGDLSEWTGANLLADPRFYIPKGSGSDGDDSTGELVNFELHNGGDWTGPDDHTSNVRVVYDDDNVYFGFVVTDEYHENAANSAWNGDSVQLMVANGDRDAQIALYNYALGGTEEELAEETIVMHEAGPGGTEAVVHRNTETKRTTYEIKLPKAALELEELGAGVQFGLGMAINDGDKDTPGQKGWGGLGAHSIVFGKSPEETALVTLKAPPREPTPSSNDIEGGKEHYTAIKASEDIVLDGDLSEWTGSTLLADPRFYIPKGSKTDGELVNFELHNGGDWTGADDHTSAVQVVYDDDNVYFGFIVTDEYHENAANSAWNGDSVQLMIANATRDGQIALYNYALGGTEEELGEETIVMHEAGPGGTEAIVSRNTETKRTTYEIKLPKEALELEELGAGVQFGLGMAINDGDKDTPGQKGWGGLGAHSIVFGKSPEETALVTLARANDMAPGKEFLSATQPPGDITLDGELDDWDGVPVLSDPSFAIPKGSGSRSGAELTLFELHNGGNWTGPDDHTSAVRVAYDPDNVYFAFVVTDEYHENSANSAWNGDSVQLMIANDKTDTQIALYNYALGGIETELGEETIVMHEAGPGGTEAIVKRNVETKRTIYEIKLPKESLELEELKSGVQFGLGMAINDGDEDTPGQRGWGGLGAHSIVFGKTPEETALVTLDGYAPPDVPCFISAIAAPSRSIADVFSFRGNSFGGCEVDPSSALLFIDGQPVELEATPAGPGETDFRYVFPDPLAGGSQHTFSIELKDTNGNVIGDTSESIWIAPDFAVLTPDMAVRRIDTSKPGFIWRIFQNGIYQHTNLGETELALAGALIDVTTGEAVGDNNADPDIVGPAEGPGFIVGPAELVEFEIATVINLNAQADGVSTAGNASFGPDDQMPGLPGVDDTFNGADAEIITFVELPAGRHTMGVNSDDGFRMEAGPEELRETMGEFNFGRGSFDSTFRFEVKEAGIYPIRVIYFNGGGGATIELFSVTEDGTKVLLNDVANGGFATFRSAPEEFNITEFSRDDDDVSLTWQSKPGRYYAVDTSSDLQSWQTVITEYPEGGAVGDATSYTDMDIPSGVTVGPPGLKGEYWNLEPKGVPTSDLPMHRADADGANAGWVDANVFNTAPTGNFVSTDVNYAGDGRNDLTPIVDWLGGDGGSYSGDTGDTALMDDGVLRLTGFIFVDEPGEREFTTNSDDGSVIYIDNQVAAQDDNGHGQTGTVGEREGQIGMVNFPEAGYYPVDIRYFNGDWTNDAGDHGGANLTTTGLDNLVQSVSSGGERYYRIRQVPAPALLAIDFEDGAEGWVATSQSGDNWELGTPAAEGITTAASGTQAWGVNLADNYAPGTFAFLRSPLIDVSSDTSPKLSFNYFIDSTFETEGGQLRFLDENGEQLAALEEIFSGQSEGWVPFSVRFPGAARGGKVFIEFAFLTDEDDEVGAGWYIDDVRID